MTRSKKYRRFYLLVAGCCGVAAVYYLVVTVPLMRRERELDDALRNAEERLADAGHGMTIGEVTANIARLQADIDSYAAIGSDPARIIHFSPEVKEMLESPFQLIDFDGRKFYIINSIRSMSQERKVALFDGWEQKFPTYTSQRPYRIWSELTVMDQLFRTVISSGVKSVDGAELILPKQSERPAGGEMRDREIAVRMQLTGPMEAIHSVIMMLPLNGEELAALELAGAAGTKSSFFLSRFVLTKSSAERPDEVRVDFVVSGFLDAAAEL